MLISSIYPVEITVIMPLQGVKHYVGKELPKVAWCLISVQKALENIRASQVSLVVKNPPANAGDIRDTGSIPGLGRSCGGGHGNPL